MCILTTDTLLNIIPQTLHLRGSLTDAAAAAASSGRRFSSVQDVSDNKPQKAVCGSMVHGSNCNSQH